MNSRSADHGMSAVPGAYLCARGGAVMLSCH
jgi:hypothetical protein